MQQLLVDDLVTGGDLVERRGDVLDPLRLADVAVHAEIERGP